MRQRGRIRPERRRAETTTKSHHVFFRATRSIGEIVRADALPRYIHTRGNSTADRAEWGPSTGLVQQPPRTLEETSHLRSTTIPNDSTADGFMPTLPVARRSGAYHSVISPHTSINKNTPTVTTSTIATHNHTKMNINSYCSYSPVLSLYIFI
jgi:hypothetical protein